MALSQITNDGLGASLTVTSRTVSYNTSYAGYDVSRLHHAIHGDLA